MYLQLYVKQIPQKKKTNKEPEGYLLIDLESAWIAVFKN